MRRVSQKSCDLSRIRLVVTDMDGVWTDGSIYLDDRGIEFKRFSAYDGLGVRLAAEAGLRIAILSGRASPVVALRAAALGVERVIQNSSDKGPDFLKLCQELGVAPNEAVYTGDDLPDLAPMALAGASVAVPNAAADVRRAADWLTDSPGGTGAIREIVEWLLREAGRWDEILARLGTGARP